MTDKQIIINGVKTSKKDFIDNFSVELTNRNIFEREQIGDKYFGIILAKEQELEQYKKSKQASYEALQKKCNELELENRKLEAELEEIKTLKDMYFTFYKAKHDDIKGIFFKYKQTLAEIKELAITGLEGFCPKCSRKECEDNNCIETAIRDILQKISEVLDEE